MQPDSRSARQDYPICAALFRSFLHGSISLWSAGLVQPWRCCSGRRRSIHFTGPSPPVAFFVRVRSDRSRGERNSAICVASSCAFISTRSTLSMPPMATVDVQVEAAAGRSAGAACGGGAPLAPLARVWATRNGNAAAQKTSINPSLRLAQNLCASRCRGLTSRRRCHRHFRI